MKVIRLGLISIVAFAVLLFLLSLLIPSHIVVSRAVDIHAQRVDSVIADIGSWNKWNEMYKDSASVRIVSVSPEMIKTIWSYKNYRTPGNFRIERGEELTVVQWYFEFHLKYPWEKFSSIVFDKQFGPPMERSLNNLKKLLESAP